MNNFEKLIDWLKNARGYSVLKKAFIVLAFVAALIAALCSCTSHRSMSVTVDKADKVDIHLTDSVSGAYPSF